MRDGLTHLEIQEKMRKVLLELVAAFNTLTNQVRTKDADLSQAFADEVAALQPTVDQLEAALVTLGAFNTTITNMQSSIDANVTAVDEFDTRLTTAEGTLTSHGTRLTTAEGTLTSHGTRLTDVEEAVGAFSVTTELTNYATMAI